MAGAGDFITTNPSVATAIECKYHFDSLQPTIPQVNIQIYIYIYIPVKCLLYSCMYACMYVCMYVCCFVCDTCLITLLIIVYVESNPKPSNSEPDEPTSQQAPQELPNPNQGHRELGINGPGLGGSPWY